MLCLGGAVNPFHRGILGNYWVPWHELHQELHVWALGNHSPYRGPWYLGCWKKISLSGHLFGVENREPPNPVVDQFNITFRNLMWLQAVVYHHQFPIMFQWPQLGIPHFCEVCCRLSFVCSTPASLCRSVDVSLEFSSCVRWVHWWWPCCWGFLGVLNRFRAVFFCPEFSKPEKGLDWHQLPHGCDCAARKCTWHFESCWSLVSCNRHEG